jgi:PAS domain S-box-containing protein
MPENNVVPFIIFLLSIGLQLLAAIYAMLLVRITGRKFAWILISIAMTLMSWRRIVSFTAIIVSGKKFNFDIPELIALVISCLMLLGVLLIRNYFLTIHSAEVERKNAEEALRTSEEHYRRIVNTVNEGIWLFNTDKQATYVNKRMSDMLGYSVDEIIGRSLPDFMDEQWHALARNCFERCGQGATERCEFQLRRKDGRYVWVVCGASPILGRKNEFLGSLVVISDITERKRAEEESEKKVRDLEIFHKAAMGREQKIIELKEKINELEEKLKMQTKRNGGV